MVFSHHDPELKHQTQSDVGLLGTLVVHGEAHQRPAGICSITRDELRLSRDLLRNSILVPQDHSVLELRDVELLSQESRHVGDRFLQSHHATRHSNERLEVFCVLTRGPGPACCGSKSLVSGSAVACKTINGGVELVENLSPDEMSDHPILVWTDVEHVHRRQERQQDRGLWHPQEDHPWVQVAEQQRVWYAE